MPQSEKEEQEILLPFSLPTTTAARLCYTHLLLLLLWLGCQGKEEEEDLFLLLLLPSILSSSLFLSLRFLLHCLAAAAAQSPLSLSLTHTRTWYMYGTPAHPTDYHMYHHRHVRSRNILSRTFVRLPTQLGYLFLPPARGEEELGRRALGTLETRRGPSSFSPLRSIEGTSQGRKSSLTRCRPLAAKGGMMDADRQMDYSWHHAASAFRPPIARRHSLLQASARMPCI